MNVQALNRHTELPGVRKTCIDSTLHCPAERGVIEHDHRVLPAKLGGKADETSRGFSGHQLPGCGGAGEHDEVGVVDDGTAHGGPVADDNLEQIARQSRLNQQLER